MQQIVYFIELQKLTLRATSITDVSLLCGIVNCYRLEYLDISSPKVSNLCTLFKTSPIPLKVPNTVSLCLSNLFMFLDLRTSVY